jgi:hypothetical protein
MRDSASPLIRGGAQEDNADVRRIAVMAVQHRMQRVVEVIV